VATHLDDADFLAQVEAVDRFTANMIAYPGRTFGQLYHRFVKANALKGGTFELDDRTIDIGSIKVPVLVFAGATDGIAPVAAVKAVTPLLKGSREVRFEIVPGGHLGMLTGRAARGTTWTVLDEWIDQWSTNAPAEEPAGTTSATKRPARTAATSKAAKAAKAKAAGGRSTKARAPRKPADEAASKDAIGANPSRRYSSQGSRSLAR